SAADALAQIIAKLEAIKAAIENNAADVVAVMTTEKNVGDEIELKFSPLDVPMLMGATEISSKLESTWVVRKYKLTSKKISIRGKVTLLNCSNNQISSLNLSKNTELEHLLCNSNQLTSLDLSQNKKLTVLECRSNQLTSLNLSQNAQLTVLACDSNKLTSLEVPSVSGDSKQINFKLQVDGNKLSPEQVNAIKGKHWKVLKYEGTNWVDYTGEQ
ncbi:MAG: hypothetical protein SPI72_06385, partial [Porphyromonas sp.]|nr:hypothetical protein [Porphyromonas sp.]